jgi:MoaA/NifB/PqqE/SkfB family radical SAM enzyme
MERNFSVVALHFTKKCNLDCPFCYRKGRNGDDEKPTDFFIDMVKYIKELAPQVALGGGEPLLFPEFVRELGKECKKHGVMLNITTNGTLVQGMSAGDLVDVLENVTMVSVSLDKYKWNDLRDFEEVIRRIKKETSVLVGVNLLVDKTLFDGGGIGLVKLVGSLCGHSGVDRVFALYPKNFDLGVDITKHEKIYRAVTTLYPQFRVDDLTKEILEQGYTGWKQPCHYGRDIISIDETGSVHGCSFEEEPLIFLKKPSDMILVKDLKIEKRFSCPFLKRS